MLNYYTFSLYRGMTFYTPVLVDRELYDISDTMLFNKFMGTMKNVFNGKLYPLTITVKHDDNIIVIEKTACESRLIPTGKYLFDVITKSACAPTIINKIIEGTLYVYPSYGIEYLTGTST